MINIYYDTFSLSARGSHVKVVKKQVIVKHVDWTPSLCCHKIDCGYIKMIYWLYLYKLLFKLYK